MAVAIVARGAASALGLGAAAFDVGAAHQPARSAWSPRACGKPFGRVSACAAARADRPRALLELGLLQVVDELSRQYPDWRKRRLGMAIGTSSGGVAALERALPAAGAAESSPADWRKCAYFSPLGGVAALLGRAPDRLVSIYGACASSALALGLGSRWLELGYCELVIAGGYDAESDWVCAGFDSLKATSAAEPRPFRAERDGMALGEGVALLALVPAHERAYGFIEGFAATTDAVHITAPDRTASGLLRAAALSLTDAGVTPGEVDFVSAHGTGTPYSDASEAVALTKLFGPQAERLTVHAFKPSVGHTLGAASALESLAALSAIERGVLPASISPGTPMDELPARLLERNEPASVRRCLKLAMAFGGANSALVLSSDRSAPRRRSARAVHLVAVGAPVRSPDVERFQAQLVAPLERLPRSDLLSLLAIAAAAEALGAAVAAGHGASSQRTGVVVGSIGATLEADAAFAARLLARGAEHAEPRRFPATSPNVCAGHVAIAFGLGGLSHAVGVGRSAALEAAWVASDWIAAGDADAMLVIGAEQVGVTSEKALGAQDVQPLEQGGLAVLLSAQPFGPVVPPRLIEELREAPATAEMSGFRGLLALCRAAGLPESARFGSVPAPE